MFIRYEEVDTNVSRPVDKQVDKRPPGGFWQRQLYFVANPTRFSQWCLLRFPFWFIGAMSIAYMWIESAP